MGQSSDCGKSAPIYPNKNIHLSVMCRLSGFTYTDVLHIYGISRAGYIPQLFSLRLPNPVVVYELLERAGAKALIYDISFDKILGDCCVPSHLALYTEDIEDVEEALPGFSEINGDATAFIFHTSGSTSGSPKLVPCSYRWLDIMIQKSHFICQPQNLARQDVTVFMSVFISFYFLEY